MAIKRNIIKLIPICLWLMAGAGVIVLLVAAVKVRKQQNCRGYDIDINGSDDASWFVDRNDIVEILTENGKIRLRDTRIENFNLDRLEAKMEKQVWIKDAELFFDNNGVLKVKITEREPVSRVFSSSGESFYLDSAGHKLPLSGKLPARLPVFTSFPPLANKKLLTQIKLMSLFLLQDTIWMNRIAQIDINPQHEFEIIPNEGNYVIEFGDAADIEDKFKRLQLFRQQVLEKAGPDMYERIKLQYKKQIIGVKQQQLKQIPS